MFSQFKHYICLILVVFNLNIESMNFSSSDGFKLATGSKVAIVGTASYYIFNTVFNFKNDTSRKAMYVDPETGRSTLIDNTKIEHQALINKIVNNCVTEKELEELPEALRYSTQGIAKAKEFQLVKLNHKDILFYYSDHKSTKGIEDKIIKFAKPAYMLELEALAKKLSEEHFVQFFESFSEKLPSTSQFFKLERKFLQLTENSSFISKLPPEIAKEVKAFSKTIYDGHKISNEIRQLLRRNYLDNSAKEQILKSAKKINANKSLEKYLNRYYLALANSINSKVRAIEVERITDRISSFQLLNVFSPDESKEIISLYNQIRENPVLLGNIMKRDKSRYDFLTEQYKLIKERETIVKALERLGLEIIHPNTPFYIQKHKFDISKLLAAFDNPHQLECQRIIMEGINTLARLEALNLDDASIIELCTTANNGYKLACEYNYNNSGIEIIHGVIDEIGEQVCKAAKAIILSYPVYVLSGAAITCIAPEIPVAYYGYIAAAATTYKIGALTYGLYNQYGILKEDLHMAVDAYQEGNSYDLGKAVTRTTADTALTTLLSKDFCKSIFKFTQPSRWNKAFTGIFKQGITDAERAKKRYNTLDLTGELNVPAEIKRVLTTTSKGPITNSAARKIAKHLGFKEVKNGPFKNSRGGLIFKKRNVYISADADRHSGGFWKVITSGQRTTCNWNLKQVIGK